MPQVVSKKQNLIYAELSYKIVGILYETYNELGYGYKEIYYQRALANNFKKCGILFKEQVPAKIKHENGIIGGIYLDFLI
ncbi:MAG: hypothetical protein A2174_02890 [Candidatus Portnoybacteria bacterium RBG_13_41_18]|uniref:GxxExxY protein n=1 Tax=Candidatus Portnoybacteria bacterium RBG_13_41_18 TaxID=1801991 RepID=A0A1G2FAX4_9BACT|nr:MAG: hypothetical protein A2174_02890 [Candidatus Portnoybacteria bacterium RBG_13_41_18]